MLLFRHLKAYIGYMLSPSKEFTALPVIIPLNLGDGTLPLRCFAALYDERKHLSWV